MPGYFIFTGMKLKKIKITIPPFLKNKYVIASIALMAWLIFFDGNDFFTQYSYRKKLNELEKEKEYYRVEIEKNRQELQSLVSSKKNLEKFAREKYLMKKDNEDIFVILEKPEKK
jgi:cell division protein FtsB